MQDAGKGCLSVAATPRWHDYRALLIDRHARHIESLEAGAGYGISLTEHRAQQAIRRWRERYNNNATASVPVGAHSLLPNAGSEVEAI